PEIQVKFRFYDGGRYIPALAVGYDGQGYFYDKNLKKYLEKGRGVFVSGSQEVVLPGLMVHPGFNISDFDSNAIYGFLGLCYIIDDKVTLMTEWDNINTTRNSRFNAGMRVHVTPFFQVDMAVRELGRKGRFDNSAARRPERIVQLRYTSNF
ncbi:MAG: hypothetical protein ABIG11_08985, partial [bacterium]